jgi:hypothetical protein
MMNAMINVYLSCCCLFVSRWQHTIKKVKAIILPSLFIEPHPIDPIHRLNRESRDIFKLHNVESFGVGHILSSSRLNSTTDVAFVLDPPRDNGGVEIQQYHLELEESKGRYPMKLTRSIFRYNSCSFSFA